MWIISDIKNNLKKNLDDFFKNETQIIVIFLIALLIRLIFFVLVKPWNEQVLNNVVIPYGSDGAFYNDRALDLLKVSSFDSFGTFHTPGYPLFISLIYYLFGIKVWVVLFIQLFLNVGSLIAVFFLGKMFFNRTIAIICSILYAIEPHVILYSVTLYSDTLFVLIILISIIFFALGLKRGKIIFFLASGFLLGLATLVRPVAQYLPFIMIGTILIYPKKKWSFHLKAIICFLLIFILTIFPWIYRNYKKYNHLSLSSIQGCNLLFFYAAYTEVDITGKSIEEVRAEFRQKAEEQGAIIGENYLFDNFDNSDIYKKIAVNYIKSNWKHYIKRNIKGIMNMYLNIGTTVISNHFGMKATDLNFDYFASPNIFYMCYNFFKYKTKHEIMIAIFVGFFLFINYSAFIVGSVSMIYKKKFIYFMVLIVIIYFSVLSGVIGLARYKLPIIPFYILISGEGLFYIYSFFKTRFQKSRSIQ